MRTFSHCARVRRSVPCTNSLSAATGGRPTFFRSFMPGLSTPQKPVASDFFVCHNNSVPQITNTLRLRIKDKHANVLCRMARDVNTTRNLQ